MKDIRQDVFCSEMWHETNNQLDGTIARNTHFPLRVDEMIFSGPHISTANPFAKTPRSICKLSSDYDPVDLTTIPGEYLPRTNYEIACSADEYSKRMPTTPWGTKYSEEYKLCTRKMLNQDGERSLNSVIIPNASAHINGIFSMSLHHNFMIFSSAMASLPYDFYIKITKKANVNFSAIMGLPILEESRLSNEMKCRMLLLNCVSEHFTSLWNEEYQPTFNKVTWTSSDLRLNNQTFKHLTNEWTVAVPLRNDFERRQALIEIDVLTSMALGMTVSQLKSIFRIQFPVLAKNEADTWYDAKGRIIFSINTNLPNVGFSRHEWESPNAVQPIQRGSTHWDGIMKHAPAGYVFERTITDDTMPGGPVQRTIRYYAPFNRCDREKDYETAWKFFEAKYGADCTGEKETRS